MNFLFGEFCLKEGRRELLRGGYPVALEPRTFDVLTYLIRHRDRAVSRD